MIRSNFTSYPEVNSLLQELLESVRTILGDHFIGMYLYGSLASGDFDKDSDVDFVVVTGDEISGNLFSALQDMHTRIATIESWCATQLEATYISRHSLRRYDPAQALHPHIDRGRGEHLKIARYDDSWIVQCYVLRECGITLEGPSPRTLIDPISPNDLRQAMLAILHGWATQLLGDPAQINNRGYQSYVALSLCRILFTLEHGTVVSKPIAARWAQEIYGERWISLIERAWIGRQNPQLKAQSDDVNGTLDFIRFTLERSQQFEI